MIDVSNPELRIIIWLAMFYSNYLCPRNGATDIYVIGYYLHGKHTIIILEFPM